MYYTIENYNPNTCARIHTYFVQFGPFPYSQNDKVFTRKKDAVKYARNAVKQEERETCTIIVCSFSYIVFCETGAKEFPSKVQAMKYAKKIKKENRDSSVTVDFFDVTAENDIVCLESFDV